MKLVAQYSFTNRWQTPETRKRMFNLIFIYLLTYCTALHH